MALKKRGVNVRVINASFGSSAHSQAFYEAIARAQANDILIVTAASNTGGQQAPGCCMRPPWVARPWHACAASRCGAGLRSRAGRAAVMLRPHMLLLQQPISQPGPMASTQLPTPSLTGITMPTTKRSPCQPSPTS